MGTSSERSHDGLTNNALLCHMAERGISTTRPNFSQHAGNQTLELGFHGARIESDFSENDDEENCNPKGKCAVR